MSDFAKLVGSLTPEKRALLARRLSASGEANKLLGAEPIAITGLSCRFPGGANSPEAFWRLLRDGVDAIAEVPGDRWDADAFYDPDMMAVGKISSRWGGFLDDVEHFDADFFGITPREAVSMDPQQRLLLEVAWEALEDAGQAADRLAGSRTGVFVGISSSDYSLLQYIDPNRIDGYTASGTGCSIAANRLSYLFDLRGPSMAVDTACSSSLVAVHLACQSLRARETNLALAGGVMLMLAPLSSIAFSRMGTMAPNGRCKTFDASADGYVRGEGCGVVVLKRLSDALSDGDHIRAFILGSAVNQDGRTTRLTAPSLVSQELVIRDALENAGVEPSQVGYVEAHGTGTALGDPIEVEALARAFARPGEPRAGRCLLGAVKSNIGHLEAAAGIAGLIKVVLSAQRGEVPANLHFRELNPHISLEETPFAIPTKLQPWPSKNGRRLAGISSFGAGGTNAHVVLEEAPALSSSLKPEQNGSSADAATETAEAGEGSTSAQGADVATALRVHLLPLSARSPEALRALAARYLEYLGADDSTLPELRDLCYTAGARRSHHQHRLCVVADSYGQLRERLSAHVAGESSVPGLFAGSRPTGRRPKVAFVFTGQGAQWPGMGRELFEAEPVFGHQLGECVEALRPHLDWEPLDLLLADPRDEEAVSEAAQRLRLTSVAQPLLFAMQVSLATLWRSWGVEPEAVVGHSMGEVAAAQVCGALSLEDAGRVICLRGRVMEEARGLGAMTAIELSAAEVEAAVREPGATGVGVAAANGQRLCVVAREVGGLGALERGCPRRGVRGGWGGWDEGCH